MQSAPQVVENVVADVDRERNHVSSSHRPNLTRQSPTVSASDQFTTDIDGLDLHFIHQRSDDPDALPLLITHGWPGSIVEFHKVIEPLTQSPDAFHVVAPSLPGFGFSAKPTEPGWGVDKIAATFATLMGRASATTATSHRGATGARP